jgi:hypothetical protein
MKDNFMQQRKLLVLDVEATIIIGYESFASSDGTFPAVIDSDLVYALQEFFNAGFEIVLATGTSGINLQYYKQQFENNNIGTFFKKYTPDNHSELDSKTDKLRKYKECYVTSKENIYFFDDAESNIQNAIADGFINSFQVS